MTLLDTLSITTVSVSADRVEMRMPVRPEIYQPHGFLHGGATIALLESCASRAAEERTDFDKELIFGLETTIRHKKARKDGMITGVAELEREEPSYGGRKQFWHVIATDEQGKVRLTSTCTLHIVADIKPDDAIVKEAYERAGLAQGEQ